MGLIEDDAFDENECRALLARTQFGRVGMSLAAMPVIFPVRYVMRGEDLYLSVTIDQLAEALNGSIVAVQADGYHEDHGRRWTALAIGQAHRIGSLGERSGRRTSDASSDSNSEEFSRILPGVPLELLSSPRSGDRHIFRLRPQILSGRWIEGL